MAENSLLIEDVVGSKAFDQLEALELNLDAVNAQVEGLVKTFDTLGKAVDNANDIRALASAQQQLNKAQTQAVEVTRKQKTAQEAVNKVLKESTQREQELQKALNTSAKSIKEARDQNKLLTAARNATNVSTREGVEQLNRLNAKIDQNNAFIKANGDQALRQKLNIGNYASALDGLGGSFGSGLKQVKAFTAGLKALIATPVGAAFAAIAAAVSAATAALKLWSTQSARGEEATKRLNYQINLVKENVKNNLTFSLEGAFKDAAEQAEQAGEDIGESASRSLERSKNKFKIWNPLTWFKSSGALEKGLLEEIEAASGRLAGTAEYYQRADKWARDMYNTEVKEVANVTRIAELQRDIALYQEQMNDSSRSTAEQQEALRKARAASAELEKIQTEMAGERVRLIQEETELTHTSQYDTIAGIDRTIASYKQQENYLTAIVKGEDQQARLVEETARAEADLAAARQQLAAMEAGDADGLAQSIADAEFELNQLYSLLDDLEATGEEPEAIAALNAQITRAEANLESLQATANAAPSPEALAQQQALVDTLQDRVELLKQEQNETLSVAEAQTELENVTKSLAFLGRVRQQASRDVLANDKKMADAEAALIKVEADAATQRRAFLRRARALENQDQADRKVRLKDYTDTLKQELANQVSAAKAAADEAKAVYDAKGNEGLNQLDDVRSWIDARNQALDTEQRAEEELVRKTAEKSIEILGLSGEEAAKVTEKMEADLLAIQEKYAIKREALANENARAAAAAVAGQIQAEQAKITADIQSELDARQVDLSRALEDGKISYRQYHKAIEQGQREALRKRLKAQIDYYEKVMQAEGVSVQEQRRALSELARLYEAFGKEMNEGKGNPTAWWDGLDWDGKLGAILDKTREVWDAVNTVVSASIQNQITDVENRQKKEDKAYEKRLEQVKNMGLSERQQELETARIEKEHEAETEKLEAEKAALQVRQAKWNKANSIVQAAISGAVAIMQAFAQAGPVVGAVFAGIIAATTAAQIATIAAQKIPEYREGRQGGPAELAIVGDGGVPEVIQSRGRAYITPPEPTLTHLQAGDRVFRNVEEYLMSRDGGDGAALELRRLRKERKQNDELMISAMNNMNAKLSVTSAGLAWLQGKGGSRARG